MSYSGELLNAAHSISLIEPEGAATLRRAVSTAYYALFHFLIESACHHWPAHQRVTVSRQFDHRQ